MTPYEAVFGQKARTGLATREPRELQDNITTGTLEENMLEMPSVPTDNFQNTQVGFDTEVSKNKSYYKL